MDYIEFNAAKQLAQIAERQERIAYKLEVLARAHGREFKRESDANVALARPVRS
jgi:hypothetical protein